MSSPGMSGKQKLVLLAGAAALYYYYRKSKAANEKKYNQKITYYRSKNGGIYYRDPTDTSKIPRPIYVVPPGQSPRSVQVQPNEAQQYSGIQGYQNQTTGNNLDYYFQGNGGAESPGM